MRKDLYLGHVVSGDGKLPDPEKVRVLKVYPTPTNTDDVKRFVAFANNYRKFIKNFAGMAYPLNLLCKKNLLTGMKKGTLFYKQMRRAIIYIGAVGASKRAVLPINEISAIIS